MGEVNDTCFNKSGNNFFTAGNDKTIRMYQLGGERATLMYVIEFSVLICITFSSKYIGFSSAINRLDVHPEMPFILGASNDKTVRVYSIDDQRLRVSIL